jgi:lipoate-protein ligase A
MNNDKLTINFGLRVIKYKPRSAAQNMALDEVLFDSFKGGAILRTYVWDAAYTTIGYFQKNDCGALRRLTGGLSVCHKDDISYSFIASSDSWSFVYNESETYKILHTVIQKALLKTGFETSFLESRQGLPNNICVQTLCEGDLTYNGRKVVGSCMRRRGNKILIQGSVHIILSEKQKELFHRAFTKELTNYMKLDIVQKDFTREEIQKAEIIAKEKYENDKWNFK